MKIGDHVRFRSEIIRSNSHLALANDVGIVVGFTDEKKRVANVVWSDGKAGTFRIKDLATTKGTLGGAIRSPWEPSRPVPLRDRGKGPTPRTVPTPVASPLPNLAPQGAYNSHREEVHYYVPTGRKATRKDGTLTDRDETMRITVQKVHVTCNRSRTTWTYTGTKRKGQVSWSDSRVKDKSLTLAGKPSSLTDEQFRAELVRFGLSV